MSLSFGEDTNEIVKILQLKFKIATVVDPTSPPEDLSLPEINQVLSMSDIGGFTELVSKNLIKFLQSLTHGTPLSTLNLLRTRVANEKMIRYLFVQMELCVSFEEVPLIPVGYGQGDDTYRNLIEKNLEGSNLSIEEKIHLDRPINIIGLYEDHRKIM